MGGSDALGCVDANIWLIGMDEPEKRWRSRTLMTVQERKNLRLLPWISRGSIDDPVLWERGPKNIVLDRKRMEQLRTHLPSIWRVLMDERSALMAGRLAWIATQRIRQDQREPKIMAPVGAAHVEGLRGLLAEPHFIATKLMGYDLEFTPPLTLCAA